MHIILQGYVLTVHMCKSLDILSSHRKSYTSQGPAKYIKQEAVRSPVVSQGVNYVRFNNLKSGHVNSNSLLVNILTVRTCNCQCIEQLLELNNSEGQWRFGYQKHRSCIYICICQLYRENYSIKVYCKTGSGAVARLCSARVQFKFHICGTFSLVICMRYSMNLVQLNSKCPIK